MAEELMIKSNEDYLRVGEKLDSDKELKISTSEYDIPQATIYISLSGVVKLRDHLTKIIEEN
jgi:hypothetical protein